MFCTLLGYWVRGGGGGGTGLIYNLLMQLFTAGNSKIKIFETHFFAIVITQNDSPRYVKHVLTRIYVVFTLFWVYGAWGRFSRLPPQPNTQIPKHRITA